MGPSTLDILISPFGHKGKLNSNEKGGLFSIKLVG